VCAPSIRVLLVDLPLLLRDLIERALRSEGIHPVGVAREVSQLAVAIQEADPDYVIVGMVDGGLPVECDGLFRARSRPRVFGVEPEDGSMALFELQPARTPLGQVSPSELVAALRNHSQVRDEQR
jgi:hypothetical protein